MRAAHKVVRQFVLVVLPNSPSSGCGARRACETDCERLATWSAGFVGQDFGELGRVAFLEAGQAKRRSIRVLANGSLFELYPANAGLGALFVNLFIGCGDC
jgi:hypothetical protein